MSNSDTSAYIPSASHRTTFHSTYDQSLSSFAPELLKHILAKTGSSIKPPFVQTFEAVGLFADVSGFTKATEALSNAMGDLGTEILAHKINAYLPHIAKKIVGSGGDVVKFAGDALLCIWPPPSDHIFNEHEMEFKTLEKKWRRYQNISEKERAQRRKYASLSSSFESVKRKYLKRKSEIALAQKEAVRKNIFAAIQCAIEIQDQFGSMDLSGSYYKTKNNIKMRKQMKKRKSKAVSTRSRITRTLTGKGGGGSHDDNKIEFRVKLGIGLGKIHLLIVGGALGRCEYLICGDGLIQAFDCENDCLVEEQRMVIISEEVVNKIEGISDNFLIKKVDKSSNYEVTGVNRKAKGKRKRIERKQYGHLIPDQSNDLAHSLASYVPAAVKPHLDMPQQIWTGELREVTILFVSLPWNARSFLKFTDSILDELQSIIYRLQVVIYKYQGSLNKFLIDDKGSTVMCVFGLPPVAHENDACRAVLAALELRECIGGKNVPAAIGVSCGTVFVGIIGSKGVRREYGILGDKVNLSARLMGLSKKNPVKLGEVIVDESVYARAKNEIRIEWSDLQCIWVKGKQDAVHIWRPARNNIAISAHKIGQASYLETSDKISLRAIESELSVFKQKKNSKCDESRVILIEGEVGIGKSSLLGQIQVRNSTFLWFLWGKANEFNECNTTINRQYIVWKQILLGFTSRYSLITPRNRYLFKLYLAERRSDLVPYLFLLQDFGIDLGSESLLVGTPYLDGGKSKRNSQSKYALNKYRHDIIFCLLEWSARIKPIAIIIDEMQYLTKKDWQCTRRLAALCFKQVVRNIALFLGSTPIDNRRYRPLFRKQVFINKFTQIRSVFTHRVISPSPWGLNKTQFFIKKYFDIAHVSQRLVTTVHSQCGGRPGFCERFLSELESHKHISIKSRLNKSKNHSNDREDESQLQSQIQNVKHHSDRNQMCAAFHADIDACFRIGLDVTFPIPAYIMSITLSHCDKLSTEQAFILKIACVICKSKGNNSIQFEEHMIRGCHPLPVTHPANSSKRVRAALRDLCEMQFIYVSNKERKRTMTLHDDISTTSVNMNGVASYNNFDQFLIDDNVLNNIDDCDHVDFTDFDGITDPMPATKALLQEPSSSAIPYKRGKMFKRGVNFINMTETQRTFVFKHRTLYWIHGSVDQQHFEEYPRSRIKFDESVTKLKREDQRSCSIKTPRKEYILRCQKKKDMDQWFNLFAEAVRAKYLPTNMMKRMTNLPATNTTQLRGVTFAMDCDDDHDAESLSMSQEIDLNIADDLLLQEQQQQQQQQKQLIGTQSGDLIYEFAYGFLRDIVYKQMLYNQRKQLHTNALKYIAKCLEQKNDDKLALLHTRHIECVQRYSDMLQGDDQSQKSVFKQKRQSFFGKRAR